MSSNKNVYEEDNFLDYDEYGCIDMQNNALDQLKSMKSTHTHDQGS